MNTILVFGRQPLGVSGYYTFVFLVREGGGGGGGGGGSHCAWLTIRPRNFDMIPRNTYVKGILQGCCLKLA